MSEHIKRYDMTGQWQWLERQGGIWVRYEDHAAAVARVERERDEERFQREAIHRRIEGLIVRIEDRKDPFAVPTFSAEDAFLRYMALALRVLTRPRLPFPPVGIDYAEEARKIDAALKETP